MIESREDYLYYLESDRISLGEKRKRPHIISIWEADVIWKFQRILRKAEYLHNCKSSGIFKFYYKWIQYRLFLAQIKTGFGIHMNVLGPGLSIAHLGPIVINGHAKIGKNCRLHPFTCISIDGKSGKVANIGDNIYIGNGAKIIGDVNIADGVCIAAGAVVTKSFDTPNITIGGVPAKIISQIGNPISLDKLGTDRTFSVGKEKRSNMNGLKKIKWDDVKAIVLLTTLWGPAKVYKAFHSNICLIAEQSHMADDNGWLFFKWISKEHPEIRSYFALDSAHERFDHSNHSFIKYGSIRHYFYYLAAQCHINSHHYSVMPNKRVCCKIRDKIIPNVKNIFLQHGVIDKNAEMFHYNNLKFDLFICGAKTEYEYLLETLGYPDGGLQYTGLARFDELVDARPEANVIVFIPTWRRYLGFDLTLSERENDQQFMQSTYFKHIQSLLSNKELCSFLEKNNLILKVKLHDMFRKYQSELHTDCENIKVLDKSASVHSLLMEGAYLITDYSSIHWDFAYAQKPLCYYQFDYEEFREKHFAEGYFSYEHNGFGPVVKTEDELLKTLSKAYQNGEFINKKEYVDRSINAMPKHDIYNCQRIFEAIQRIFI